TTNSTFFGTTEEELNGFSNGVLDFVIVELRGTGANRTITATLTGGAATGTSAGFTVEPGAAAQLEVTQEPSRVATGAVITPSPAVRVLDAYGNVRDEDDTSVVTVTLLNAGDAVLLGTTPRTAS